MKILVLSDSHSALRHMRDWIAQIKPDAVVHLGDHYDDGVAMAEENPHVMFYQVPGNCDRYRCPISAQEVLCYLIGGVRIYMTHGHLHDVKRTRYGLLKDARAANAQVVLYGHTHSPECTQEPDGLWVLNPGSCGYGGGSAGLLEITDGEIRDCRVLRLQDREELL